MQVIYSILIQLLEWLLPISKWISPKQKKFVDGRKNIFQQLKTLKKNPLIWIHTASLGEYEQAVPIMKRLKQVYPRYQLLVTFFSPSGYEIKKNDSLPDFVCYLPLDTTYKANRFVKMLHIKLAVFVKYEVWPNYMKALTKAQIPSILVSALFRENQIYFKPYGGFMLKSLTQFNHIFVQNEASYHLLKKKKFNAVSISGDTRYDRVSEQLQMNNQLRFMEAFKQNKTCFVFGSSWPEDEMIYIDFINANANLKFVIAPHEISVNKIAQLTEKLNLKWMLYSKMQPHQIHQVDVLVMDTIGLLTKVYAYADVAYVGGGMGTAGLHNILEPATFGVPVIIGKNYEKFPEAIALQEVRGLFSISTEDEFGQIASKLIMDDAFRRKTGAIARQFVKEKAGATPFIIDRIKLYLN